MATLQIENLFSVKGKIALVTGGGTGLGKIMAQALVQNGAKVYIASRKQKNIEAAAAELNSLGPGQCIGLAADLSTKANCYALAAEMAKRESKLDILINNSGLAWAGTIEKYAEAGWDKLVALNVKSVFYMTVALLPLLEKGAHGNIDPSRVINITSMNGVNNQAENTTAGENEGTWSYNATKAAADHLTRILSVTLAGRYITCNAIAPGIFPTNMTSYGMSMNHGKMLSDQPMGRLGSPFDLGGLALYLSSKASAHLTGQIIQIAGGQELLSSAAARL
ncbi:hypothetical protein SmJEL517_g04001 [Synchytrium microbalum]|uniref:Rhamnolipids biosynthesis 3-oxoacyl-[acyl-carrier-protein] reductase n=1 Tax=Synchytrium microbalum TaxID=1806994 RepID=A0A507C6B0_9FUNG|nr:uncharacterized protein SmJEL517_g04001 [Synchytrium microbalum]TPX33015.1 hypothetical protein SmJEL517_g04001 [Synchytrium microbalum]